MFPVTVGFGGGMPVALNALTSIHAIGVGGTLLRSRPFDLQESSVSTSFQQTIPGNLKLIAQRKNN